MKTTTSIVLLLLMCGSALARDIKLLPVEVSNGQTAPADTSGNAALDEMLSRFLQGTQARTLPYDSWTFTLHRYLGYSIVVATATQAILGAIAWSDREAGRDAETKTAHRYLGYTTAGLSLAQSSLGYINAWKMRDKATGKNKRIAHLGLSTLATAGFVTAAILAYTARQDIESGDADREHKSFSDLYSSHRTAGILSAVAVTLTVIVIEW